jgi:DNA (cytosine-5)-methyltransferase 1
LIIFLKTIDNYKMKKLRVLNLYAGLGGNRKHWQNADVTAVEYDDEIAAIYKENFPDDQVIIADAHEFLLKHYKDFDFIWTSPPCPTHSRARFWHAKGGNCDCVYPDWHLWQEIIFLKHYAPCKYVVENVIPFYEEDLNIFLPPSISLQRHLFWANFSIRPFTFDEEIKIRSVNKSQPEITANSTVYGFNISKYKISNRKDQILRNLVNPDLGLYILEQAQGIIRQQKTNQTSLF